MDNLRRERVAAEDDPQAAAADYLADTSVTNDLAVLTPYDISFRCFSSDLAGVISGFASSKNGFIIRYLNVEPAAATAGGPTPETPAYVPPPPPAYVPPPSYVPIRGRGDFFEQGGGPRPAPAPVPSGVATANRYATVINEKVFRVSLRVEVVKLLPQK